MKGRAREQRPTAPAGRQRGLVLSLAAAVLLLLACPLSWADVQIVVFHRSYAGTHFGEGQATLALAASALLLTAIAGTLAPRLVYGLPLLATAALGLTVWKYHDVGHAFSSFHGFRLASASAGTGLVLAIIASALLLGASLVAVLDTVDHPEER